MKQPRSTSMNRGADDERAALKAHIEKLIHNSKSFEKSEVLKDLVKWIDKRKERTKEPGGLGR